jgi:hypothetical protein
MRSGKADTGCRISHTNDTYTSREVRVAGVANLLERLEWWWFSRTIKRGFMQKRHGWDNPEELWRSYLKGYVDADYVRDICDKSGPRSWEIFADDRYERIFHP